MASFTEHDQLPDRNVYPAAGMLVYEPPLLPSNRVDILMNFPELQNTKQGVCLLSNIASKADSRDRVL